MPNNSDLRKADRLRNDEFFTQFQDIQKEMNAYLEYDPDVFREKTILLPCDDPEKSNFTKFFAQNFENFGLKKLISTSYAADAKKTLYNLDSQISMFESESPKFNEEKSHSKGKKFVLEKDVNGSKKIDIKDLEWDYLDGDGDFRSDEVKTLRDSADIIITNPPFSLFRPFLGWIIASNKKFIIIGNMNAITYKEVFPLIKANKMWMGCSIHSGDREFGIPDNYPITASGYRIDENGNKYIRVKGVRWFTNIDHGRRHQKLDLMTMQDNIKFSKHKDVNGKGYEKFDNYDAINIPYTDAIPSDYEGLMGVPISFLDKYNPDQFEIIDGIGRYSIMDNERTKKEGKYLSMVNGEAKYFRIVIRKKEEAK